MNHVMSPDDEVTVKPIVPITQPQIEAMLKKCLGKPLVEAETIANDLGFDTRVESPDEAHTMDFRIDRVNFKVRNGAVSSAEIG